MWPDRISNPGPLTYESGALPTALRGPAAEEEQELEALVESLDNTCKRYMEVSAEETRLMTNCAMGILREIMVKRQNLGTIQASSTSEQLFQMMAPNQRFSQGLHKPLQLLQS